MNRRSYLLLAGGALAAAGAPIVAAAQSVPVAATYLVTTAGAGSVGTAVVRETLTLERTAGRSRIAVEEADGTIVSVPVTFTADGAIASSSQNGSVTCYNMAASVLARVREPDRGPATVYLRFGNSVVPVPLAVRATSSRGTLDSTALRGTSTGTFGDGTTSADAGITVDAAVEGDAAGLRRAVFDEVQYVGSPERVVGRSTCILQRAERSAVKRT